MPGKDGTGPLGKGPIARSGRGQGRRGRMRGPCSAGPGGRCICPNCGYETIHMTGQPCSDEKCSKCGAKLIRG
jgi:uncharacterized protein